MANDQSAPKLISRKEAKALGLSHYFTGLPCRRGHISERQVISANCMACNREWHKSTIGQAAEARRWLHDKDRREKQSKWGAARYLRNKEDIKRKTNAWYWQNNEYAKTRQSLYTKSKRVSNPEVFRAYHSKRRAQKLASARRHTADDILAIIKSQRVRCAYCRTKLTNSYHVDHIMPLSRGGSNGRENLQILCARCNLQKSSRDPLVHARERGLLL